MSPARQAMPTAAIPLRARRARWPAWITRGLRAFRAAQRRRAAWDLAECMERWGDLVAEEAGRRRQPSAPRG